MTSLLRRNREFRRLWLGQTISVVGDQVSMLALPLVAVLVLDASAAQMGLLTAAGWAPYLLLALAAGIWVDRRRRRRLLLVAADVGRALVIATVPVAWAFGVLTFAHLLTAAFVVGAFAVVFQVAYSSLFPRIVAREDIVEANGLLSTSRSAAFAAGPAAGGAIVQALGAPVALALDAISFLASGYSVGRIQVDERPPVVVEPPLRSLAAGFRFLFGHPVLRALLGCFATINFFNLAFGAIVVLYMSRELGLSPAAIGLVLAAGAVGGVIGSFAAPAIGRRLGIGRAVVLGAILFPLPLVLFPLASGPEPLVIGLLVVGELLSGLGVMVLDIHGNSLGVFFVPDELRPRQTATFSFVNYGVRPLGALAGGALGTALGLQAALLVTALAAVAGVLWLLPSPTPGLREVPAEPEGAPVASSG